MSYSELAVLFFLLSLAAFYWAGYCLGRRHVEEAVERAVRDRSMEVLDCCLALWGKEKPGVEPLDCFVTRRR